MIERRAYAEAPPRVEYRLTDLGQTLTEPIATLTDWARTYGAAVVDFQEAAQQESTSGSWPVTDTGQVIKKGTPRAGL